MTKFQSGELSGETRAATGQKGRVFAVSREAWSGKGQIIQGRPNEGLSIAEMQSNTAKAAAAARALAGTAPAAISKTTLG